MSYLSKLTNWYSNNYENNYDRYYEGDYSYDLDKFIKNDYQPKTKYKVTQAMIKNYIKKREEEESRFEPITKVRTNWDRVGDMFNIGIYPFANALHTAYENSNTIVGTGGPLKTPWEAFKEGVRAANPFGEGYEAGEHDYIELLNEITHPDTIVGKVLTGSVGFLADIFLDPTNLIGVGIVGGLVKGTGKAAHAVQHADDIKAIFTKYGEDVSNGMSIDSARRIIIKDSQAAGRGLGIDSVDAAANKMATWYNKQVGIRDYSKESLNISLGNMLGGERFFGKQLASKKVVLFKGDLAQKIGDKTLSRPYHKLRNAIHGTQLMRKFSNNPLFYDMAKKDPGEIFNFFRFIEDTRGLNVSKLQKEEKIREYAAKNLQNLTPADHKKLIELMEDPTQWRFVTEKFNFINTERGLKEHENLRQNYILQRREVQSILKKQSTIKQYIKEKKDKLDAGEAAIERLTKEYSDALEKIDLRTIHDLETLDDTVKALINHQDILRQQLRDAQDLRAAKEIEYIKEIDRVKMERADEIQRQMDEVDEKAEEVQKRIDKINMEIGNIKSESRSYVEKLVLMKDKESVEAYVLRSKIAEYQQQIDNLQNGYTEQYENFSKTWNEILKGVKGGKEVRENISELRSRLFNDFDSLFTKGDEAKATAGSVTDLKKMDLKLKDRAAADLMDRTKVTAKDMRKVVDGFKSITKKEKKKYHDLIDQLEKIEDVTDTYALKNKLIMEIGEFLVGDARFISDLTTIDNVANLMRRMKQGNTPEEILEFIAANEIYYNGRSTEIFRFIGDIIGYGYGKSARTWNDYYNKPMKKVINKIMKDKSLDIKSKDEIKRLITSDADTRESIDQIFKVIGKTEVLTHQEKLDVARVIQAHILRKRLLNECSSLPKDNWEEAFGKLKTRVYDEHVLSKTLNKNVDEIDATRQQILKDLEKDERRVDNFPEDRIVFTEREKEITRERIRERLIEREVTKFGPKQEEFIERVIDSAEKILKREWKVTYGSLEDSEENWLIYLAWKDANVKTGAKEARSKMVDLVSEEIKRRHITSKRESIMRDARPGAKIYCDGNKVYTIEEVVLKDDGIPVFKGKDDDDGLSYAIKLEDIISVMKKSEVDGIEEMAIKSPVVSARMRKLEELQPEMEKAQKELDLLEAVKDAELRAADEELDKAIKQMEDLDKQIDALEVERKKLLDSKKNIADDVNKDKIEINRTEVDELGKKIKEMRKKNEELKQQINNRAYKEADIRKKNDKSKFAAKAWYINHRNQWQNKMLEHEKAYRDLQDSMNMNIDFITIDDKIKNMQEMGRILNNHDAFDTFMRARLGSDVVDKIITKEKFDLIEIVLKDDVDADRQIRDIANHLRKDFIDIAKEEISIGKLRPEQLESMIMRYLPHVATDAGQKYFSGEQIEKSIQGMGDNFGFGRVWNPFGISRSVKMIKNANGDWIKEFNVMDENEYFKQFLKGKNAFSENIYDIYLTRMTKHTELMYDNQLMEDMLNLFGKDIDGDVERNYQAVMNCGMLKSNVKSMTKMLNKLDTEDAIDNHFKVGKVKNPYYDPEVAAKYGDDVEEYDLPFAAQEKADVMKVIGAQVDDMVQKLIDDMFTSGSLSGHINFSDVEKYRSKFYSQLIRKETKRFYREELHPEAFANAQKSAKMIADSKLEWMLKKEYRLGQDKAAKRQEIYDREYKKALNYELTKQLKIANIDWHNDTMRGVMERTGTTRDLGDLLMPMVNVDKNKDAFLKGEHAGLLKRHDKNTKRSFKKIFKQWQFESRGGPMEMNADELRDFMKKFNNLNHEQLMKFLAEEVNEEKYGEILAKRIDELYKKRNSEWDGFNAKKPVVKQVHDAMVNKLNQARKIQIEKDHNALLQFVDKFTHWVKLMQTTVLPGWHFTNKKSNIFNNWLGIGNDALNPHYQLAAYKAMRGKGEFEEIFDIIDEDGFVIGHGNWKDLYRKAEEYGVIDKNFVAADLGVGQNSRGLLSKLNVTGALDLTDTKNFFAFKYGAKAGNVIEGTDRLIHFMSMVRHGKTYEEAAESVNHFLFDYSDVTAFEASVMKRIIPFYTWMRKNVPLQLEQLIEQPKKYQLVTKTQYAIESYTPEEDRMDERYVNDFALDWIQTPFRIKNKQGKEEHILYNSKLPYMDISRLGNGPLDDLKTLFTQSNALIKVPLELMNNYNTFYEAPIMKNVIPDVTTDKGFDKAKPYLGNAWDATKYMLNQLTPFSIAQKFGEKKGVDFGLHAVSTLTGEKILSYDYETYKYLKIQQLKYGSEGPIITKIFKRHFPEMVEGYNSVSSATSKEGREQFYRDAKNALAKRLVKGAPLNAEEYVGALRPISQSRYEKLSPEEKLMYTPPDVKTSVALNKEAVRLAELAKAERLSEVGRNWGALGTGVTKLMWSFLERTDLGNINEQYKYGEVTRIIDGDTFEVNLGDGVKKQVRMLLIDTPESVKRDVIEQPGSKAASEYTKKSLIGKDVKIIFDTEYDEDDYGRMLAYVEYDDGKDIGLELVQQGLAKTQYIIQPPYDRLNLYKKEQNIAAENDEGVWNIPFYATNDDKTPFKRQYDAAIVRKLNKLLN